MVRDLHIADTPRLLEIAELMHGESVYKAYPLNLHRTKFILEDLIHNEGVYSVGVTVGGELVGVFLGEVSTDLWADVQVARDIVLYLVPEHRGGGHGVRLLKGFKKWAEPISNVVVISVFAGIDNEKMAALLGRMGYSDAGSLHIRRAA
jgi:GNAT superfamily N-acetyltransferase